MQVHKQKIKKIEFTDFSITNITHFSWKTSIPTLLKVFSKFSYRMRICRGQWFWLYSSYHKRALVWQRHLTSVLLVWTQMFGAVEVFLLKCPRCLTVIISRSLFCGSNKEEEAFGICGMLKLHSSLDELQRTEKCLSPSPHLRNIFAIKRTEHSLFTYVSLFCALKDNSRNCFIGVHDKQKLVTFPRNKASEIMRAFQSFLNHPQKKTWMYSTQNITLSFYSLLLVDCIYRCPLLSSFG